MGWEHDLLEGLTYALAALFGGGIAWFIYETSGLARSHRDWDRFMAERKPTVAPIEHDWDEYYERVYGMPLD